MKIENDQIKLTNISKIVGVMAAIILLSALSAFIGSLVYFVFPANTEAAVFASMLTGFVLWWTDNRFNISRQDPNAEILDVDLNEHPDFGIAPNNQLYNKVW